MGRPVLHYTFGNHMHWVDMQWLWGYHVLPGSVRDMLTLCREAGVKGCVNFDGVGLEKLAAEAPEALAELRQAVQEGIVEPVGGSYGQPYGLFHGGESNVRQLTYGVRAAMRLLGKRPRTFWEEEFYFFPQLPQLLRGCGYDAASLFFQWTWHTPEVPFEDAPVVRWEGLDGSQIPAATRNRLNLHQWPEDFDPLLDELARGGEGEPLVAQWLELMPSPDWMCRSEVLLPRLRQFLAEPRFDVRPTTLGDYVRPRGDGAPVRRTRMDDVWHGMTLGKNGDRMRRESAKVEHELLAAEALAATASLFGRPYAQWDVYPVWELEEAWRELLAAQHHDNEECEGLCGDIGEIGYRKASWLAEGVFERQMERLAGVVRSRHPVSLEFNPSSWPRQGGSRLRQHQMRTGHVIPPFTVVVGDGVEPVEAKWRRKRTSAFGVEIESGPSPISQIRSRAFPEGCLARPMLDLRAQVQGRRIRVEAHRHWEHEHERDSVHCRLSHRSIAGKFLTSAFVCPFAYGPGALLRMRIYSPTNERVLDPGLATGFRVPVVPNFEVRRIFVDTPYGVEEIRTGSRGRRKYPEGDWMTSPQWFEDVEGAIYSSRWIDLVGPDGKGLFIAHDGSSQWWRTKAGVEVQLLTNDPWDEANAEFDVEANFRIVPHGRIGHAQRYRWAEELVRPTRHGWADRRGGGPFTSFAALHVESESVVVAAFYRETEDYSGRDLDSYAGRGMGYPFVVRLVETSGRATEAELTVAGPVAAAFETNLMGEPGREVAFAPGDPRRLADPPEALAGFGIEAAKTRSAFRPFEIKTLYLDLVPGRKRFRDLDAERKVWASAHR